MMSLSSAISYNPLKRNRLLVLSVTLIVLISGFGLYTLPHHSTSPMSETSKNINNAVHIPFAKVQVPLLPLDSNQNQVTEAELTRARRTLHLIFQLNPLPVDQGGKIMEADWIRNTVLAKVDRPIQIHVDRTSSGKLKMSDSLTVFLHRPNSASYFDDISPSFNNNNINDQMFVNMGAYHMGDERYVDDLSFYNKPSYVLRNYYRRPKTSYSNVTYIPLGIKSGFPSSPPSTLPRTSERPMLCNFIGSKRANRGEMLSMIYSNNLSCFISADLRWADKRGIPVLEYHRILLDSKFTFTPWGNNPESLRLYEALEAGSIPIYQLLPNHETDFFWNNMRDSGIPVVSDWEEVPGLIEMLLSDPEELNRLQKKITDWWVNYKLEFQLRVKQVIDRSFFDTYGDWV